MESVLVRVPRVWLLWYHHTNPSSLCNGQELAWTHLPSQSLWVQQRDC